MTEAFKYNAKAHYAPYGNHSIAMASKDFTEMLIIVQDNNKTSNGFTIKVPKAVFDLGSYQYFRDGDIYTADEGFQTSRSSDNFQRHPMKLWEVQLNFAVHCATSALGVSTEHLNAKEPLVRSLYRFHTYYHVRRILKRMQTPIPSEDGFDKYNNAFSLSEIYRIGDEYGATTKNFQIYKDHWYFEVIGGIHTHNNWSKWIINSSHG